MYNNKAEKQLSFAADWGLVIGITIIAVGVGAGVMSIIASSKVRKAKRKLF